jgi:hypothetical protein
MFDSLVHEVAVFGTATGLSVGSLICCGLLFYFLAEARPLAIAAAITTIVGFGGFLYGEHDGRADVKAEWAQANASAAAAAVTRDKTAQTALDQKYQPIIAALQKQSAQLQQQVLAYEKRDKPGSSCELGAAALRLRK